MEGEYNTNKEERKRVRQLRVEARNASGDNEASMSAASGSLPPPMPAGEPARRPARWPGRRRVVAVLLCYPRGITARVSGNKRGKEAAEESSRSKGQQQIANSLTHLDKKKGGGIENITQIRVAADWREARRRVAEEQQRQDRLQRLQEEAVRSGQQNAAVEMRWAELLDQNMPQELHDDIEAQKSACSEIVASKDALIREFQLQLKLKDEEYVKALKQQADDVEELLRRMRLEFKELHEEYEVELEAIEDAFLTERDDVLQANKAAVDSLFEQRREMELQYMDRKRAREEAYQTEIEDLLVKDAEEYNKLKIKLETDIQALEQQLEEMRATYQLNTEKLEYNYRVLTERDNENSNTLAQLKRKQNKLKEVLSGIVAKYQETDSRDRKKNDELTEEYRRITKQYRDLQAKFRHFELSDQQRFDKIWRMHEDEAGDLVAKVLQADEIIQRQQLGWDWRAPDLAKIRDPQQPEESPAVVVAASDGDESRAATVPGDKLKAMLELLASEAGFLVEGKVREALDKLSPEEAELAQAESMLRALGVQDEADVAALVGHFFTEADADDEDESASAAGTALRDLGRVIKPDDVVRAIRRFVDERRARGGAAKTRLAAEASGAGGGGDAGGRSAAALLEERDFWHRLSGVVSQDTSEVWSSLEKHLQQYNQILHDRAGAIRDCASLNDQNLQLKELLNQYLHAKVNDDLIIRPADTIQLPLK